jgi:pimeloyl-ACP methyl ester carboxylesterase
MVTHNVPAATDRDSDGATHRSATGGPVRANTGVARAAVVGGARSIVGRTKTAFAKPTGAVRVARLAPVGDLALDDRTLPWPGQHVVVNGARLYVRRVSDPAGSKTGGAGRAPQDREPALFVHGLAGSSTNWTDLGVMLGSRLDGVALDLPGFGRSGPAPRRDYSISASAGLVIAYLEQSARGPVHLFGNSMGGAVSLRVAALRPDLVRTLTLISPAVPDLRVRRPGTDAGMLLLLVPGVSNLVQRRIDAVSPEERARGLIEVCFADPSRIPPHRMAEAVEAVREREHLPWVADAFRRSLRGLVSFYVSSGRRSAWQLMARITVPTLVVWGDQDRLVDVALAPRVARTIPGARLLVLPGVGHTAQLEDPVVTARAFLALRDDAAGSDHAVDAAGPHTAGPNADGAA